MCFLFFLAGTQEHGPLCRPEQPNKTATFIQAVDGEDYGGVLPTGRQRTREGDGDQRHVRQTHCLGGEESGKTSPGLTLALTM